MKTHNKALLAAVMVVAAIGTTYAQANKDGFTMKQGEMMITQNGKTKVMQNFVEMGNGTEVRTDGLVVLPNADLVRLKEGDSLGFDGTLTRASAMPTPTAKN